MLDGELRPFQRTFLRRAMAPGIDLGVMSVPRGNGKTSLAAHVVARHLTPGDPYYQRDNEIVLISGSTAQSRFAHKFVRRELEHLGIYRWSSSLTSMGARDTTNGVELRVMSSNPRTAHGLVGVSLCFCDEPVQLGNTGGSRYVGRRRDGDGEARLLPPRRIHRDRDTGSQGFFARESAIR